MPLSSETVDAPAGTERIGAIACWGFGLAWAIWGITGVSGAVPLAIAGLVTFVSGIFTAAIAFRSGRIPRARRLPADWQRRYNRLVLAEFVAIFLASLALGRTGHPEAIPVAICLIVGLHFFPLARLFDMTPYRCTALALCLVAIIGGGLLSIAGAATVRAVVGFGAAVALWTTAARIGTSHAS